jgi:hypothetical protein
VASLPQTLATPFAEARGVPGNPPVICAPEELLKERPMVIDSVITPVRPAHEELAKRFNYELRSIIQDARERQAADGRRVVTLPPRPVKSIRDFGPKAQRFAQRTAQP